ncbi:enoyl-CoA hydratase-related protein [Roseibium sediminicola]|uniref:Enoyl-CoA hydratase-related protein n=1 Tax=Roseibium sediminicola TaxID=2933272 RepID=A0ABT0GYQ9_9HYPH|nr:enoyl-CoA hydratase-related protein [Roseibium sp. CAU 1639]MCK7614566.1 enoyl-CoA hydratase-related protein [Roseibium sp. CAU 1639]
MTPPPADTTENPLLSVRGAAAELWLNAPAKKNALPLSAWQAVPARLDRLREDPAIRVCIVRGAGGRSFCAGADISEFEAIRSTPEAAKHYDAINVAAFKALKTLPVPVIAAIEGPCLGGGLGLALACDLRIAARSAYFAIPAARLGLAYPPEALGDLLEAVSPSDAKALLFTAERLSAEKALRIGLINEVVEDTELDRRIELLCATLCANAPLSLKAAKRAINRLAAPAAAAELDTLFEDAETCINSADYREGCRAFLDKRAPRFTGS